MKDSSSSLANSHVLPGQEGQRREALKSLGPTIIVAIDDRGASVAQRLASLFRAHTRFAAEGGDTALRERFAFLRVQPDRDTGKLSTEVQAIKVEPSAQLWDLSVEQWQDSPLKMGSAHSFTNAFDEAVKQVLSYTKVREELHQSGLVVRPSHLNVFFVGSIVEQVELPPVDDLAANPDQQYKDLVATLSLQIETKLGELGQLATQTRNYAADSASLETVVRGAFLTLILPDSRYAAKEALKSNGTILGNLLKGERRQWPALGRSPGEHSFAEMSEPPLHFSSVYTSHDEGGAWYESDQLANAIAGAIYGLTMSELLDHSLCRSQLGLQDLFVSSYDRLITIAATRSSFPKADLLDYAALMYGAALLDQLVPDQGAEPAVSEVVRSGTARLLKFGELRSLLERPLGDAWDRHGKPRRLTRVATEAEPPDLFEYIKPPRQRLLQGWDNFASETLAELERYDELSAYLEDVDGAGNLLRFVDENNRPVHLNAPDGRSFIYTDEDIFVAWQAWRKGLDARIGDEPAEMIWRVGALRDEFERTFWGDVPQDVKASGTAYVELLCDEVERQTIELRHLVERASLSSIPRVGNLEDDLADAKEQCQQRVEIGPIVALSSAIAIIASYLFLSVREASGIFLRRPDLTVTITGVGAQITLPEAVLIGVMCGIAVLITGLLFRQMQLYRALQHIKAYAALVRRKYAIRMYTDEQRRLDSVPESLEQYVDYLRRETQIYKDVARSFRDRLHQRAEAVAELGFRDVTEYIPMSCGGGMKIYRELIASNIAQYSRADLPRLRRTAQSLGPISEPGSVVSVEFEQQMRERAEQYLLSLVLGDRAVPENNAGAGMRHLAYSSVQRDMDIIAAQNLTRALIERADDLRGRTPLLLNLGFRPGQETFHQAYTIAPVAGSSHKPELQDTIEVRSIDPQMVMYTRIVSRVWPRIFDSAELKLEPDPPARNEKRVRLQAQTSEQKP